MSSILGIGGINAADHTSQVADAAAAKATKDSANLHKMSKEFEAMFVRQILTAAKIGQTGGGKGANDAYNGMGIDGLAGSITEGKGLGLAQEIEDQIRRSELNAGASSGSSSGSDGSK